MGLLGSNGYGPVLKLCTAFSLKKPRSAGVIVTDVNLFVKMLEGDIFRKAGSSGTRHLERHCALTIP
jgi:hypothetical protein